jgi:hypothetical protein
MSAGAPLSAIKRPTREGDHVPLSRAKVQNERSHNSMPPMRSPDVDRDNVSFLLLYFWYPIYGTRVKRAVMLCRLHRLAAVLLKISRTHSPF